MSEDTSAVMEPVSPWGLRDIVSSVVLAVILIVAPLSLILIAAAILTATGVRLPQSRVALTVALIVLQNAAFMVGIWLFGLRRHKVGIDRLGLRPYLARTGCSYAAFAWLMSLGFNLFYSGVVTSVFGRRIEQTAVLPLFGGGLPGFALALVLAALLVPFVEEMFFRGFVFPGLARRFGRVAGVVLSGVLFGAAHLSPDSFIPLSFMGIVLSLLYSATGSLYPGIILHSINNSVALLAAFLSEAGLLTLP